MALPQCLFHPGENFIVKLEPPKCGGELRLKHALTDVRFVALPLLPVDYWTLIVGSKFSQKERQQISLSRFYAIAQIEYCRNFIFQRHFPIHKIFQRSCEIGLWLMTANVCVGR
jgi:hypothetical protein